MNNHLVISGIGKRNKLLSLLQHECKVRKINLLGLDASLIAPAKYELDCFSQVPRASDHLFIHEYSKLVAGSVGFLTIVDPEIVPLSIAHERGMFGDSAFLHPDHFTCNLCEDKLEFGKFMSSNGQYALPVSAGPDFSYPMIIKERRGSCSSGFLVIPDPSVLDEVLASQDHSSDVIFQPFCDGTHYCVDAYFSLNSHRLVDLCVKRVESKQRGESYALTTVKANKFIDLLNDLGALFSFLGIINLDIYDCNGSLYVMEVNCRIGGNYPVSHMVGVNLIAKMLDELTSRIDYSSGPFFSDYQSGLTYVKYFDFSLVS